MNAIIIAPIVFPLIVALITFSLWKKSKLQELINLIGSFCLMIIGFLLLQKVLDSGIQVMQAGNWEAPFGITIVADTFSAVMSLITGVMAFSVSVYSISSMKGPDTPGDMRRKQFQFAYYPLLNIMYMGINGAFLTGDLFNMYVWFEVMLISSFVLLSLGGSKLQLEGTFKYVTINLISSALFLVGTGLLYSITGTLNMAHLAEIIPQIENRELVTVIAMLFLICFGIKAAVFPLFFWLPASYHTPPISISAIFAGMLTKVGVYSLIRVFTLMFLTNVPYTHTIILWISALTMLVGVLGAASQYDMRRILSFHIISQIGYMILGLALFTPLAIAGSIFYIMHHIIVKANLFLVSGIASRIKGHYDIRLIGSLLNAYPFLAVLFLIPALSLAGIPPLSGFWSKFFVVKAGLDVGQNIVIAIALLVGLLTLYSMTKIWNEAFFKEDPRENLRLKGDQPGLFARQNIFMVLPVIFLAAITLTIGFYPEPFFKIAEQAANELMNPSIYINTVLRGTQ
jgi:multicomponent Na+:H+ antiporter subunit D